MPLIFYMNGWKRKVADIVRPKSAAAYAFDILHVYLKGKSRWYRTLKSAAACALDILWMFERKKLADIVRPNNLRQPMPNALGSLLTFEGEKSPIISVSGDTRFGQARPHANGHS